MIKKKAVKPNRRSAGAFEKAMGIRVRTARMDAKLSQAELGDKLGVTFQQVQKYEKGMNRVSGARLSALSAVLGRPLSFFMEDPNYKPNTKGEKLAEFVASRVGHQLCEAALELSPAIQQSLLDMAKSLTRQAA